MLNDGEQYYHLHLLVDEVVCPLKLILEGGAAYRLNNLANADLTCYI